MSCATRSQSVRQLKQPKVTLGAGCNSFRTSHLKLAFSPSPHSLTSFNSLSFLIQIASSEESVLMFSLADCFKTL